MNMKLNPNNINPKLKPRKEMTIEELYDWINWAKVEISEYKDFVKELKQELILRKK